MEAMMDRECKECGAVLRLGNPSDLCSLCQEKKREREKNAKENIIDAQQYAERIGLKSAESVKRRARKNKLAPRIPGIRQYRWRVPVVEAWEKNRQLQEAMAQELTNARKSRRLARLLASNLRRLKNDNYIKPIYEAPSDIVFGTREYLGTTDDLRIDVIQLPKISKASANGLFGELPAKDFPELEGIEDWGQLPLDRISEDFLTRLESYF
jgi:uncharacterized Zn finger protein (UPF0148 family)